VKMFRLTHLLDSDVIIWVLRGRKETVRLVEEIAKIGVPACSPLSLIEVLMGAKPEEEERTRKFFSALELLPVDRAIAEKATEYIKAYQDVKNPDFVDAIIAATAVVHDLALVTYNRRHYPMPGIRFYPPTSGE